MDEPARADFELTQVHLRRLYDLALDMICVIGTDGYFRHVNPAFTEVLGHSREELLARPFLELIHPDDREPAAAGLERLGAGKPLTGFINRYRARDGSWRWLSWKAQPLAAEGLVYATARDVTFERKLRAKLRGRARELQRSNQALDDFAYVASHDLKAPLRDVDNLSKWIVEDLGADLPPATATHLERLRSRVVRMERLLDDLLDYSRAARIRGVAETFDAGAVVRDAWSALAPPPGFDLAVAPEAPRLTGPRAAFARVVHNLLGNAVKHHDRSDGRVEVAWRDAGEQVEVSVTDDGRGIPARFHERVFGMFQTLRPRDDVEGSGMGLALARKLVESVEGEVGIESRPGEGTTLRFTWPRRFDPATTEEAP